MTGVAHTIRGRPSILALGALGVVFGDIGTSPLYAFQAAMAAGVQPNESDITGVVSLFIWALLIIVGVKYIGLVMRVSNNGEGGVLALSALVRRTLTGRTARWAFLAGLVGVGLFYADGAITPAVSVLSAAEGIEVAAPGAADAILPAAIVVITILFAVQRVGTGRMGSLFGPVMLVWFAVLGLLGIHQIVAYPDVLVALEPTRGLFFLAEHPELGLGILGAVVLCVTGVEALYADMGHFGRAPIALAWFTVAMPAVLLNYLGQAALVIHDPSVASNPFFNMGSDSMAVPLLVLATVATFVASQAVISGVFSITRQAIQVGLLPRERVLHTSEDVEGQVYIPFANWALFAVVIGLVAAFGSSQSLAGAYGIAVTATMVITTLLIIVVALRTWKWRRGLVALAIAPLLLIDLLLLAAVTEKIPHGGWVPLATAAALLVVMVTWQQGRNLIRERIGTSATPLRSLLDNVPNRERIPGVAVFMSASPKTAPHSLMVHLQHNVLLHEALVIVTVRFRDVPRVAAEKRVEVTEFGNGIHSIELWFGFVERPDVPSTLAAPWRDLGLPGTPATASYVVSDDTMVVARTHDGMAHWQKHLFVFLHRNAERSAEYFGLPPDRVIHLGTEMPV